MGATLLDGLFQIAYMFIIWIMTYSMVLNPESHLSIELVYLVLFSPIIFYNPIMEYFFNGQTLGKMILKIRVLSANGGAASMGDIILRWLLRTIDVYLAIPMLIIYSIVDNEQLYYLLAVSFAFPLPIIGMVSIIRSEHGQRLGDLAANTVVIQTKDKVSLNQTMLVEASEDYEPVYPEVIKLRDKDINTIKRVLDEAKESKNYDNVEKLADKAAQLLEVKPATSSLKFLKTLLKDYNHVSVEHDKNPFSG